VVGYAPFDTPPPDFHAVFEVWLGGRWALFDPTRMSPVEDMVRIATGRDAKDVAFATFYGPARMVSMEPRIERADRTLTPQQLLPATVISTRAATPSGA
jgi:transglutaminase-like putative cysteine protease